MRIFSAVLLAFLALSTPLAAQNIELHVVGVYEGNDKTDGRIHGPEVRVRVEQTDAPVVLALTSYEAVRWYIEAATDAQVEKIFVGGYAGKDSEVYVNNTQATPEILEGDTYSYRAQGKPFRTLVATLTKQLGVDRLASFSGAYRPKENQAFVVDETSMAPQLSQTYLGDLVRPQALPTVWEPLLDKLPAQVVRFNDKGFVISGNDDDVAIPISLDVPRISWPVGAAFDAHRNRIYGVTLGGEGYLYQYDMVEEQWSVLTSMENRDAAGMLLDADGNRLIMGTKHGRSPSFIIYDLRSGFTQVDIEPSTLAGYFDLYDIGNGPTVPLVPVAVQGDTLLAQAGGSASFRGIRSSDASRTYVIDLNTGRAALVAYRENLTR